ncbi:MAG: ATP-binding cassette domain-containing protein [Erysipelotrichaceae bacterium]
MLEVNHITKNYGRSRGINDISFKVKDGMVLGLLGSNGSGKTTTFRVLLGLLDKEKGEIKYNKKKIEDYPRFFGYLPEERSMLRDLKVKEQITYLGKLKNMKIEEIENAMNHYFKILDIEIYKNRKIIELSKGNQQKVQLVCALIHNPKIVILDEPLNGLDIANVMLFKKIIMQLKKEKKIILLSSHLYDTIENNCDSVLYLKEGKILFQGDLIALKKKRKSRMIKILDKDIDYWKQIEGVIESEINGNYVSLRVDEANVKNVINIIKKENIQEYSIAYPCLAEIIKEELNEDIDAVLIEKKIFK